MIVGAGPTGVETAGAVADLVRDVMPERFHDLAVDRTRIYLVDLGHVVLGAFSDKAHDYAARKLEEMGVTLRLGTGVKEVTADRVDAERRRRDPDPHRGVGWRDPGAGPRRRDGPARGPGRTPRRPSADLNVEGYPRVYAIGDMANVPDADGNDFPQLGSVALQAGRWAAHNIVADIDGKPRTPFHYKDKGIMAMIGSGAAVAEMGAHHHELHGHVALRRLARRARLADERRPPAGGRLRGLGVGLLRLRAAPRDHRRPGRRPDRLGRRDRRRTPRPDVMKRPHRRASACLTHYDVIIIGSGAGGGTLAHTLADAGQ